jgi:hypothetical protein
VEHSFAGISLKWESRPEASGSGAVPAAVSLILFFEQFGHFSEYSGWEGLEKQGKPEELPVEDKIQILKFIHLKFKFCISMIRTSGKKYQTLAFYSQCYFISELLINNYSIDF